MEPISCQRDHSFIYLTSADRTDQKVQYFGRSTEKPEYAASQATQGPHRYADFSIWKLPVL